MNPNRHFGIEERTFMCRKCGGKNTSLEFAKLHTRSLVPIEREGRKISRVDLSSFSLHFPAVETRLGGVLLAGPSTKFTHPVWEVKKRRLFSHSFILSTVKKPWKKLGQCHTIFESKYFSKRSSVSDNNRNFALAYESSPKLKIEYGI